MSIRTILLRRLLIALVLILGGGSWISYQEIRHEGEELFDAQLARSARLILSLVQADRGEIEFSSIQKFLNENQLITDDDSITQNNLFDEDDEILPGGHIYETKLGFQIWNSSGNLVLKSPNLPDNNISTEAQGFSDNRFDDHDWRTFTLTSADGRYRCITAERIDVRSDLIGDIFEGLLQLFIVIVPVLSVTLWLAISQGLKPLQNLTSQIKTRDADKLDAISEGKAPMEIQTITSALNQLLSRLKNALARERRITSDAAHELRTPLAAVKLHAELAGKADNAGDRKAAIDHVLQGIDRTTRLVNQLLDLARLEPESFQQKMYPTDISKLLIEETALQAPIANDKQLDLAITENPEIIASVDETSIRLLIRNLLSNAIAYTTAKGIIRISLQDEDEKFSLIVEDNGSGIPIEERQRVFERFYRLKNHDETGCGIGLSIVMQVVEMHQATLSLDDPDNGTGLRVTVTFPVGANPRVRPF